MGRFARCPKRGFVVLASHQLLAWRAIAPVENVHGARCPSGLPDTGGTWKLASVAGINADIVAGEIARPDARVCVFSIACAPAQIHHDRDVLGEKLAMRSPLAEGAGAATAENSKAREMNLHAIRVKCHAGTSRGGKDATPIGIGSCQRGLYQWRICDRAGDSVSSAGRRRASDLNFDNALGAFAIRYNREGE
jgi:hypothetical protein